MPRKFRGIDQNQPRARRSPGCIEHDFIRGKHGNVAKGRLIQRDGSLVRRAPRVRT
jgi:hypothetical protein